MSGRCQGFNPQNFAVDTARIVAVGGDGHLNEVLNGFIENDLPVNPEARLSFVMTGTGCDFQS